MSAFARLVTPYYHGVYQLDGHERGADEELIELTLEGGRFPDNPEPEADEGTTIFMSVGDIRRLIPTLGRLCDVADGIVQPPRRSAG